MQVLYFDVEWANPQNKSICQIGLMSEDVYSKEPIFPERNIYVNPNDSFDRNCVAVHGITLSRVEKEKGFDEIWNEIKKYFINSIIIAHNAAGSDLQALVKNLSRYNLDIPEIYYVDTLEIARHYINPTKVRDFQLKSLCEYYGLDIDSEHDAFDDACACSDLFAELMKNFDFDIKQFIRKYEAKEIDEFVKYVAAPEIRREINMLLGAIVGIKFDNKINQKEVQFLQDWQKKNLHYGQKKEVKEIISILGEVIKDEILTEEEWTRLKHTILLYIQRIEGSKETLATQYLNGLLNGIVADSQIVDEEVLALQKWLYENSYLEGHYPYDLLFTKVNTVLADGIITASEKEQLLAVMKELFSPIENIKASIIDFKGKSFCLSGDFFYGTKSNVSDYIRSLGGCIHDSVKKQTDYVVIGDCGSDRYSNGSYGSKAKRALEWRISIITEKDLFSSSVG